MPLSPHIVMPSNDGSSTSTVTPPQFIQHLLELATQEHEHEALETSLLHSSCSISQLVSQGLAISNLRPTKTEVGLGGRTLVHFELNSAFNRDTELHTGDVRNGDLVKLIDSSSSSSVTKKTGGPSAKGKGKAKDMNHMSQEGIQGVVWKVQLDRIVVALGGKGGANSGNDGDDDVEVPPNVHLLKLSNPATFHRQRSALQRLLNLLSSPRPLSPLNSILLGLAIPSSPSNPPAPLNYFDDRLNDSQKEAIDFALRGSEHLALIWGPPGTGKTQTLVEIIRQLVSKDKRVLVVGGSNLSVDNVLQRLSIPSPSYPTPIPLTRLGHPARVLSSLTSYTLDSQTSSSDASEINIELKEELQSLENRLRNGFGKDRIKGSERKKKWDEVRALRKDYRKREGGVVKEVLAKAKVVLATTHGAGGRNLEDYRFDVVIIDEAAQVVEPSSWIPILKGDKLILAGDDCQLPPTIKSLNSTARLPQKKQIPPRPSRSENDLIGYTPESDGAGRSSDGTAEDAKVASDEVAQKRSESDPSESARSEPTSDEVESRITELHVSEQSNAPQPSLIPAREQLRPLKRSPDLSLTLFSRLLALHGPSLRRMLNVQYRFNSQINDFPSAILYNNQLVPSDFVKNRTLLDLFDNPSEKDEDLGEQVVFWDTAGQDMFEKSDDESKRNENEAQICSNYVEFLIEQGLTEAQITLISPYNAQVALLAQTLHPTWPALEIGSIDGMQGRENEVVIISLVRSNTNGEVGFLSDERRLNVAMTRPKRQLVVIGDSETVKKGSAYLKKWMLWLEDNALVKVPE